MIDIKVSNTVILKNLSPRKIHRYFAIESTDVAKSIQGERKLLFLCLSPWAQTSSTACVIRVLNQEANLWLADSEQTTRAVIHGSSSIRPYSQHFSRSLSLSAFPISFSCAFSSSPVSLSVEAVLTARSSWWDTGILVSYLRQIKHEWLVYSNFR